ncbi:MAG: oxidoreductase [Phycisphaerales bacterium]|nr:oxidoreductase [Phycisphaerales bacterium]
MSQPDSMDKVDLPAEGVGITRRDVLATATTVGVTVTLSSLLPGCSTAKPTDAKLVPPAPDVNPVGTIPVSLNINGQPHQMNLEPRVTLLDALREDLGLTGTKKGCDHGQCGACTVLIDGKRMNSCLTLACSAQNKKITTVEGLAKGDELHPVQQAFIDCDAFQCGYCTPGQICSAVGAISEGHLKSDDDIREQMSGNICRCGAYPNIVNAVRQAMQTA